MARASKRSFVSRIVSKVTEIKNILAEVTALTAEKTNLQSDPVTNAQAITEKTQRIESKSEENGYIHIWGAKNGDKKLIAKKVYKILYYLGLGPRGNPTWKNGELIDIN
jgi:hypothetical protein